MIPTSKISTTLTGLAFLLQTVLFPVLAGAGGRGESEVDRRCQELADSPNDSQKVGSGVPLGQINLSEALPVCQQAATRQPMHPRYQYLYGRVLRSAKRYADAAQQYSLAKQGGYALAAVDLGDLYRDGQGVSQDFEQAEKLYREAAKERVPIAFLYLGLLYGRLHKDKRAEFAWYLLAAQGGVVGGQYNVAAMYEHGEGVTQDYAEAVAWYRKAAQQGSDSAMHRLGLMYENGEHVPQDYAAAAQWFYGAAKQGDHVAQGKLGYLFYTGQGVTQDYHAAFSWFLLAVQAGLLKYQYALGTMCENGQGVTKNDSDAVVWYRKAADWGDVYGMDALGVHLFRGTGVFRNEAEAIQWFRKAADGGFAPAQIHLAILYENGWGGVNQDLEKAKQLFLQAANSAVPEIANQAKRMAASIPSPSSSPSFRPQDASSDTSSDTWKGLALVGGAALLLYLLSGPSGKTDSSVDSSSAGGSGVEPKPAWQQWGYSSENEWQSAKCRAWGGKC
jgi:TPR repeat protein